MKPTTHKQAQVTPEMVGAGVGAAGAGLAAYLMSKKNKARNTLLAILAGGAAGSAAGAGYRAAGHYGGINRARSSAEQHKLPYSERETSRSRARILPDFLKNTFTLGLSQPTEYDSQGTDDYRRSASNELLRNMSTADIDRDMSLHRKRFDEINNIRSHLDGVFATMKD